MHVKNVYCGKQFCIMIASMHENTKQLRDLMQRGGLKIKDVANITNRKRSTIRVWRCRTAARVIPDELLRLIELEVSQREVQP